MNAEEIDVEQAQKEIVTLSEEKMTIDIQESELNGKIAELRAQIESLKERRHVVRARINQAQRNKDSAERKLALKRESEQLEADINKRMAELADIVANAPWKDDAFGWQIEGAAKLPSRALLGDKRGLGKTLSSLIWRRFQGSKKTLVCVRKEVAADFIKEIRLREPSVPVYPMISATPHDRKMAKMLLEGLDEFIVVTNIESWRRDVEKTTKDILTIDYDAVILDEAHNIKNSKTGTAQGFFQLADRIPNVLEMTGTPIKNRPQEMYSLLHALYPNLFQKESHFLRDYCVQIGQNKWLFSEYGLVHLVNKIKSFYLARDRSDIGVDLPPPNIIKYELDMDAHLLQKTAYNQIAERAMAELTSGQVIPIVSQLAIMTRLAQALTWPAGIRFKDPETGEALQFDVHQSVKVDWAEDTIKELVEEGERIVLFSRFKAPIYELQARLIRDGLTVAMITGDSKDGNQEVFNDFDLKTASKTNYKNQVLLATYQTVGESANLNAAAHMVLLDRYWTGGNEDQAIGRIDRINSKRQATVHIPHVTNSFDDYMDALIESKRVMVNDFKDATTMRAEIVENLKRNL